MYVSACLFGRVVFARARAWSIESPLLFLLLTPALPAAQVIWEELRDVGTAAVEAAFPGWASHTVRTYTLTPGDVLFLPPYWIHRIEALGGEHGHGGQLSESTAAHGHGEAA